MRGRAGKKRVGYRWVERVIARQLEAPTELPWTFCAYASNISTTVQATHRYLKPRIKIYWRQSFYQALEMC